MGLQQEIDQSNGWQQLKQAMINDASISTERCANYTLFRQTFVRVLEHIKNEPDREIFTQKIRELMTVGDSCSEGWLRDINFLFNPLSKNLRWTIHHHLAKLRDAILEEALQESGNRTMSLVGGNNDIHLVDQIAWALWHRWRSYRGELYIPIPWRDGRYKLSAQSHESRFPEIKCF